MRKNRSNYPRRKRMKQTARLDSAKHWIRKYEGKNIVKGYSNWYGVSMLCAVNELKLLGIVIDDEYVKKLKIAEEDSIKRNRERRQEKELLKRIEETELKIENEFNGDIITSCLFDDEKNIAPWILKKACLNCNCCDSQDLPFGGKFPEKFGENYCAYQGKKHVTISEMAEKLHLTKRAIEKQFCKLQEDSMIRRIGPDKGGYWKVVRKK